MKSVLFETVFRGCDLKYSALFIFKGLQEQVIKEIVSKFTDIQKFKKGEIIYSKDFFKNALGFIIKGSAFAISNNNSKIHLQTFNENMCFGAASLFGSNEIYVSTIIAKTDMEIIFINEEQLKDIFIKYPETSINYISFLSDKVRFLNTKLQVISCMNAEDTVLTYLSNSVDSDGFANIPKNMTVFAKMLGLSRATLYRILDILEKNEYILKENNKIKVIKNEKTN